MKKILLLMLIIVACAKDDPAETTLPPVSNELPPPSFTIPPPVVSTPEPDFEYNGGDISISSREEFNKYKGLIIKKVTGDFKITVDWVFLDGSSGDPSSVTKHIEIVEGDVTIITTGEFSMENLIRVEGEYSVEGHDIEDDNLLYAKKIKLDYDDDYKVPPVYSDGIEINVGKWRIKKSSKFNNSSKGSERIIDIVLYHTSLLLVPSFSVESLPPIRTIAPIMPPVAIYPSFIQTDGVEGVLSSDAVDKVIMGGHVQIEKIVSNSINALEINNTELSSITVESTSVESISIPLLEAVEDLVIDCSGVDELDAPALLNVSGTLSLTGVQAVSLESVTSINTLSISSGGIVDLPVLDTVITSSIAASVAVISSAASGIASAPQATPTVGGGGGGGQTGVSQGSSGITTPTTGTVTTTDDHNSGGSHNSGGTGG